MTVCTFTEIHRLGNGTSAASFDGYATRDWRWIIFFESDGQYQVHHVPPHKKNWQETVPEYPCIYIYISYYQCALSCLYQSTRISQLRSRYAWHRSQPATSHLVRHRSLIETHPARMPRTRFVDALGPNTGPLDSPTNAWEEKLAIFKRSRKRTWILVVSSTELLEDCSPLLKKTLKATNSSQPENEPLRIGDFDLSNHQFQIFDLPAVQRNYRNVAFSGLKAPMSLATVLGFTSHRLVSWAPPPWPTRVAA